MDDTTVPSKEAEETRVRRSGLMARLRGYFMAGILVTAPTGITCYLAWLFLVFVDDKVKPLIPARYNPEYYLPFSIPGLGLIILLLGLTAVGMLAAGLIGRTLLRIGESIVQRMPIVRGVYSASKQVIETVVGQNATSFREVVLIEFPRRECWVIGFITGVAKGEIGKLADEEVVNVFVPTTPNPTGGYVLFLPRREVIPLKMSVEDGLKLVVSMGIVTPPDPGALPARRRGA
ncbi:MAG: DUF502 domain-containing protein [Alphaproteobacteria bacterium]|nr:DUF502 domain-containing protein [Alphaproteobacteria bacterium]